MPIDFSCPHCGQAIRVSDESAGRSGRCPKCQQPVTIPSPAGPAASAPPPVHLSPAEYAPPAKSSAVPVVVIVLVAVLGVMVVCGGILAALMLPAVQAAREAARRMQCQNNLKQIGLALHNYHATYKCFPPAYTTDENGKPMHSWRVLILPYLEQQALYDRYRFDEPWDSPGNRALARMTPSVYRCPSAGDPTSTDTSYAVIVSRKPRGRGPVPAFCGDQPARISDFKDGTSNTLTVVEVAGSKIHWMEPRDLDVERMPMAVNGPSGDGIQSKHPGGANAAFGDGSVQFLSGSIDEETLRRLIHRDDRQPVDYSRF